MPAPTGITRLDALIIPAIVVTRARHPVAPGTRQCAAGVVAVPHGTGGRAVPRTWLGDDDEPGIPDRLARIEWHVGNGRPEPLHRLVERISTDLHDRPHLTPCWTLAGGDRRCRPAVRDERRAVDPDNQVTAQPRDDGAGAGG